MAAEGREDPPLLRENRNHSVISNLEARLVETENKYWASISAINESYVNLNPA